LIGYELDGEDNYRVGKLRKVYSVSALLNGIEKKEQRQQGNTYVNCDFLQGEKVAKINQSGGNMKLTHGQEQLIQILKQIKNGKSDFAHDGKSTKSLKEFQSTVIYLKEIESQGYIGKVNYCTRDDGLVYVAFLDEDPAKALTYKGLEVLDNPEKLIIDSQPQASNMNTYHHTTNNINNNGIVNLGEINGNVSQTIQQLPSEQNDLKVLLSQLQTLINSSPLTETAKQKALTKTQDIAEVTQQPEEEQKNIVQKTLGYFDGLADSLESGTETAIKLGETVAGIAHLFGL